MINLIESKPTILSDKQLKWAKNLLYDPEYFGMRKTFPDNISQLRTTFETRFNTMTNEEFGIFIDELKRVISADYILVCGLKVSTSLVNCGKYHIMGELEACLHECPKGEYVGGCEAYAKYESE